MLGPDLNCLGRFRMKGGDAVQARRLVSKDTRTLDGVQANPTLPYPTSPGYHQLTSILTCTRRPQSFPQTGPKHKLHSCHLALGFSPCKSDPHPFFWQQRLASSRLMAANGEATQLSLTPFARISSSTGQPTAKISKYPPLFQI